MDCGTLGASGETARVNVSSVFELCETQQISTEIMQERAGVKMILIQDGSQPPNIDKPLRIIGDPYKVQVDAWLG